MIILVDTNVFVGALLGPTGPSREIIRKCLLGSYEPLMGVTLFNEYEDVLNRRTIIERCALDENEREELLDAFLSVCHWTHVYYAWRPNLRDEGDNHLIELAVAGNAEAIITWNVKDFDQQQLSFPHIGVYTPEQLLET